MRHTALPFPGTEQQLLTLASRAVSQRLDRTKPLWEMWLVEGLEEGRWAVIAKTHHAMIDGAGGIDLLTTLFDLSPETRPVEPQEWHPRPVPSGFGLVAAAARHGVGHTASLAARAAGLAVRPDRLVREGLSTLAALAAVAEPLVNGAPSTPLNRWPSSPPSTRWRSPS